MKKRRKMGRRKYGKKSDGWAVSREQMDKKKKEKKWKKRKEKNQAGTVEVLKRATECGCKGTKSRERKGMVTEGSSGMWA